jgi:hypothetical protein
MESYVISRLVIWVFVSFAAFKILTIINCMALLFRLKQSSLCGLPTPRNRAVQCHCDSFVKIIQYVEQREPSRPMCK